MPSHEDLLMIIDKGFIENEWKAVSNSLLQRQHIWVAQMDE